MHWKIIGKSWKTTNSFSKYDLFITFVRRFYLDRYHFFLILGFFSLHLKTSSLLHSSTVVRKSIQLTVLSVAIYVTDRVKPNFGLSYLSLLPNLVYVMQFINFPCLTC